MKEKHKKEFYAKIGLVLSGIYTLFSLFICIWILITVMKLATRIINIPAENLFWSNKTLFLLIILSFVFWQLLIIFAGFTEKNGIDFFERLKKFKLKEVKDDGIIQKEKKT